MTILIPKSLKISIISHLLGVQNGETAIGSATTGSSEAIHLGGLAMKRRWQEKRDAEGKDRTKPNIIMGSNAQVALEKFARYFEVEARILDVSRKSKYRLGKKHPFSDLILSPESLGSFWLVRRVLELTCLTFLLEK